MTEQEQIYQYIQKGQRDKALKALFNNIEENPNVIENYINAGFIIIKVVSMKPSNSIKNH